MRTTRTHGCFVGAAILVAGLALLAYGCAPRQAEGCPPAWQPGTQEEVEKAVGFQIWTPKYVPKGYAVQRIAHLDGAVSSSYEPGGSDPARGCFNVMQMRAADHPAEVATWSNQDGGEAARVNGCPAVLQKTRPEAGDKVSRGWTSLRWQQNGWLFMVDGDIDPAEILRVANSLAEAADRS